MMNSHTEPALLCEVRQGSRVYQLVKVLTPKGTPELSVRLVNRTRGGDFFKRGIDLPMGAARSLAGAALVECDAAMDAHQK